MSDIEYSVAIFAYNTCSVIESCINSVLLSSQDHDASIYVLANGCSDSTEAVVKTLQKQHTNLHLASIPLADKANAWNYFVHQIAPNGASHFFIDSDVQIQPDALSNIFHTMNSHPQVNVVGGVPTVGRDQIGWINRMLSYGRISGGLYALSDSFIQELRKQKVKLPIGFIGEDFLVSALAKNMGCVDTFYVASPRLRIEKSAGFSFRQLSRRHIRDYILYFRRLVRYRVRDYQLSMLMSHFKNNEAATMPTSVKEMYKTSYALPGYYWRGRYTVVDWLAVYTIRNITKKG